MTDWYVAPGKVAREGSGTFPDPWSLEWAGSLVNTAVRPGDRVFRRGSKPGAPIATYKPFTVAHVNARPGIPADTRGPGFVLARSGLPGRPIIYADYEEETSVFADPINLAGGWSRIVDEPGRQIWESNFLVGSADHGEFVGGYFVRDGVAHLLSAYRFKTDEMAAMEQLSAITSKYRPKGDYDVGPGVVRMRTGKLRIRLDPHIAAAQNKCAVRPRLRTGEVCAVKSQLLMCCVRFGIPAALVQQVSRHIIPVFLTSR